MVNYHVLMNSIVVNYEGITKTVSKGDKRYNLILKAIQEDDLDSIPGIIDTVQHYKDSGFEVVEGSIFVDGVALPEALSRRVVAFMEASLPFEPLLKLWDNLKNNPSFNSRKMLYSFLEHNGHPITEDGCFIAYRGVSEDFKDLHSGTFDNSVGALCEMSRDLVDDNPDNTCSSGLHVACFDYANGFGPQMIEVKVNPIDVVCVPRDYNGTKMRVCKFEVVNVCKNIRNEELYEHEMEDYAEDDYSEDFFGSEEYQDALEDWYSKQ